MKRAAVRNFRIATLLHVSKQYLRCLSNLSRWQQPSQGAGQHSVRGDGRMTKTRPGCYFSLCLILVIALLLASSHVAMADTALNDQEPQWFLTDELLGEAHDHGESHTWPLYEMVRGDSSLPEGAVAVPLGSCSIWMADYSTPQPAPFGNGAWNAKIMLSQAPCDGEELGVYLGYILPDGFGGLEFRATGSGEVYKVTGQGRIRWFEVTIDADEFTVPAGGWLAFKVVNETCLNPLEVRTGQSCGWVKPPDDPTYPVPELPGLVLLGIGLFGLAGWMGLRSRRVIRYAKK